MERTQGDGIDNSTFNKRLPLETILNSELATKRSLKILQALKPVQPNSKVYYLTPKHTFKAKPVPNYFVHKQKEPKFVPCEPYKAAVEPMVSKKHVNKSPRKTVKNNMDLHNLVSQLSETRKLEMSRNNEGDAVDEVDGTKLRMQWKNEKDQYEIDIQNLRSSNTLLETQLKFQAQVNSELKTLLVAAVGEDLENRVQHLTEDKLSLARELLKSANHLTSHQEQTEWLSGQCEVWRSKFLASSLMVEELAKWKSALTNRSYELQEVIKTLLDERKKIHVQQLEMFDELSKISKNATTKDKYQPLQLKYGNVIQLSSINVQLVENLRKCLNVDDGCDGLDKTVILNVQQTVAEKNAHRLLNNPVTISSKPDVLCNAVIGAATSISNEQMFLQYPSLHPCCAHCTGNIQNI
ncbi:unnamed protein product [Psylliodes chrysocephalus]|uniref:Golgin-45 n=1 Tax=Psylliodes chrysocephalus TaxID=3402493 RepID=A0A9P0D485_9CUCU|nr:unnamed protein product [Psylliodes chrysocephala]